MAPQTRGMSFPNVVIERDSDTEESSEDEEQDEEEESVDDEVQNDAEGASDEERVGDEDEASTSTSTKSRREPITISLKKVCKVHFFLLVSILFFLEIFGNFSAGNVMMIFSTSNF